MVTALAICYALYPWFINFMKNKRMEQIIRDDGPQTIENKIGTPTMGGVPMILSINVSTLLWARLTSQWSGWRSPSFSGTARWASSMTGRAAMLR